MAHQRPKCVHIRDDHVNRTLCGRVVHHILLTITQAQYWSRRTTKAERIPVCKACIRALQEKTVSVGRKTDNRPPRSPRVNDWNWDHDRGTK